jgi:squalene cyclase
LSVPARSETDRTEAISQQTLERALDRGIDYLRKKQQDDGSWISEEYYEPRASATHLITLAFIERLPAVEMRAYARFLVTLQRPDGSWESYPYARKSDLAATALVYAALKIANLPEHAAAREKALGFIEANGGFDAVLQRLYERGDTTALYLSMADLIDPFALPDPHLEFMITPGVVPFLLRKINAAVIEGILFLGSVTRFLREKKRPSGPIKRWLYEKEAEKGIEFIEFWLNPNGNNNGTTLQTDLAIATLYAFGRPPEHRSIGAALDWFQKLEAWDGDKLHLNVFTNENWMTCLSLRALLYARVPRNDTAITSAVEYLCWSQSRLPMPEVNLRREDAHRIGGWGFEEDNLILPDCDDTGLVLSALGLALDRTHMHTLPPDVDRRCREAVQLGLANLLDMQSDNGGWAGFVWNYPPKKAGPIFDKPIGIPKSPIDAMKLFLDPPVEFGEPPVEGLTGRVLQGLAANGFDARSPEVQRAAAFLKDLQMDNGMWWARWIVAYVASTSSIISGLADCGWDMSEPWVQKGIAWLLSKQNPDGGWGETPEAYEDVNMAGVGQSMPPLTGMAVIALIDAGMADHEATRRGIANLLAVQNSAGTWDSNEWLQVYEPSTTYYFFPGDAWYRPIEALAKYRTALYGNPDVQTVEQRLAPLFTTPPVFPPRTPPTWSKSALRAMRAVGDRTADDVIHSIVRNNETSIVRQLMGTMMRSDEPIPAGLPAAARAYFQQTEALPSWADKGLIARGQRVFTDHGWLMAAGLFCTSLPQAYCAANGARVLTETQGMTRHVRHRILETAQFLFDVCSEGGLEPGARGIRSAQKVRLMHGMIRHLVLMKGEWDVQSFGVPVNQEDYAGTLMTFSAVLLDAVEKGGVQLSSADQEAYLHLWKVVGHILGVHEKLIPVDVADARALMEAIREDQWAESAEGKLLAWDLVQSMDDSVPGQRIDNLPVALIRFFSPPKVPVILDLPEASLIDGVLAAGSALDAFLDGLDPGADRHLRFLRFWSYQLMKALVSGQREGKQASFRIPDRLIRAWNLDD